MIKNKLKRLYPMRALFSKNPSRYHGWELQRRHWGCSIQNRCLLTINPVAVVASFEVCAVGSGIKGGSSRRLSMSCLVDNHAACSTFKGGFGRHQAQASSMVAISPIMILGGEVSSGSLQKEVSPGGWWHAHVGMVGEQFRPPDSLCRSMPSSTRVRPPDLSVGIRISWAWCEALWPFIGFEMMRASMIGLGPKEDSLVLSPTT